MAHAPPRRILRRLAPALAIAAMGCLASPAFAVDRVYWGNYNGNKLSFAALNDSGGADLTITGTTVSQPQGVAIDAAAGKIYWAQYSPSKIRVANLNGTGGGDLPTGTATVSGPTGLAIDPAGGRIYWANNSNPNSISYANLDGSGGANLPTPGAMVVLPDGVAVDHAAGKIYWTNYFPISTISWARLDGTGGGDLTITGPAKPSQPSGLAIDATAGKLYWADAGRISYVNVNGGVAADLVTTGATVSGPDGVAIDPLAGRIYWANFGGAGKISFANRNGTGGRDLITGAATTNGASYPVLLEAPRSAGAPTITGAGSKLTCSAGTWAPDIVESFLYRAPRTFAYRWSRNGIPLTGPSGNVLNATSAGEYQCEVGAVNQVGVARQTSAARAVFTIGKAKRNKRKGTAALPVTMPDAGTVLLGGKAIVPTSAVVGSLGTINLTVAPKGKAKKKLNRKGKVKVTVQVTFKPNVGTASARTTTVKLVKKRH